MVHRLIAPRTLAGGCVVLALGCASWAAGASAAQPPAAATLVAAALKDATAAGSVHQTITNVAGGRQAVFSNDIAGDAGSENITVSGGIRAHVLITPHAAYVSGNRTALAKYFGFPTSALSRIGANWVSIASTNAVYPAMADQATLSSVLGGLTPSGPLTEIAGSRIDGQSVIGVRGSLPKSYQFKGTMTVYVTRSAHPLPVMVRLVDAQSARATSTSVLTDWGERVVVQQPTGTIPIGSL